MNKLTVVTATLALLAVTMNAQAALVNGSFETGDFTGWTLETTGSPFRGWSVDNAGSGGGFLLAETAPQDGNYVAWNGFDGHGPMKFVLFQDVLLPTAQSLILTWQHRLQWNYSLGAIASEPRTLIVDFVDPATKDVLLNLFSFSTGTQTTNPTGDSGWQTFAVDISAFAGQTGRIRFTQNIPQSSTGPGQAEFDAIAIRVVHVSEPTSLALLGLGVIALALRRRIRFG